MAYSYTHLPGDGSNQNFTFNFGYLSKSHISVRVNGVVTAFNWITDFSVQITPAPASGAIVEIRRKTPLNEPIVDWSDGSTLTESDMDLNSLFSLYAAQEAQDGVDASVSQNSLGVWDGQGRATTNFADPTDPTGLVTKNYFENNYTPALDAKVAAAAASASAAATSASQSQGYAALADSHADEAAALLAIFKGQYLGAQASDPTVDGNGQPVTAGDLFFNTTTSKMRVYTGISWQDVGSTVQGTINKPVDPVIATAGQTTVPVPGGYDSNYIIVTVNGVGVNTPDVDVSSGTDIVFASPLSAGDEVSWVAFGSFNVANTYTKDELNGTDGSSFIGWIRNKVGAVKTTIQKWLGWQPIQAFEFMTDAQIADVTSGTGSVDVTVALQKAADAAAGQKLVLPAGTYMVSDKVTLASYTKVDGSAGAILKMSNPNVSGFYADGKTGVTVKHLRITCPTAGTSAYIGGVHFNNSTRCKVVDVEMDGLSWAGVFMNNSSSNLVERCRFDSWRGTMQDSAGVTIYNNSNENIVRGNFCFGGSDHAIFIQDPYTGATPYGNKVLNNTIGAHKADGILVYVTTPYDTRTLIDGNHIRDIQGTALSGQSGHGIYIQSAGGTIVTNNTVSNCCVLTTSFETQVVAGIGVSTWNYATGTIHEVIVANNRINAPRGPAIAVQTSNSPVLVHGNSIISTGTAAIRGEAIYAVNAVGLQVHDNTIHHANTNYGAINIVSSGTTVYGTSILNNHIRGAAYGILFNGVGGGNFGYTTVSGNKATGLTSNACALAGVQDLTMVGNTFQSTGQVFVLNNCPFARLSGNRISSSSGTYSIVFTGSASGNQYTVVDESNFLSGIVQHDAGTGGVISQYGNAAPLMSGLWAVGDRVIAFSPGVGGAKGWRCTAAGNPGTWTSEGAL